LALITGILFGLAPALRSSKTDLVQGLKADGMLFGGMRAFGMRNGLVVVQVSLSMVLLIAAGLFLRSLQNASTADLGMKVDGLLMMSVDPSLHSYSKDQQAQFFDRLRASITEQPGVQSVSYVDILPLSFGGMTVGIGVVGEKKGEISTDIFGVDSKYFETVGTALLRGRDFAGERLDGPRVAIINKELAHKLFGDKEPLGQQVRMPGPPGDAQQSVYEVIGVVANAKSRTIGEEVRPCLFRSLKQSDSPADAFFGKSVLVRTNGRPEQYRLAIEQKIHALDANLPIFNVQTMEDHTRKALLLPRLAGTLFTIFGASGLALATVGLYGVMSYSVRRRTREIGIRMALGAGRSGVLTMITRQGLSVVLVGSAIGLAISLAASRLAVSLLYGVSPLDPLTFLLVPLTLFGAAMIAVIIPARRAARVDPMVALRYE
jgi:predicted permease